MTKLQRVTGKVFGGSAPLNQIGQFGSALAGNPTNTQDVATIQALSAYSNGWGSGVVTSRNFPPIEEVTGVLKTISYQACYLLQEGIPEYDINTEYSNTSIVKSISGNELIFYISLADNNIGNSLTDTNYWTRAVFVGSNPIGAPQLTLNPNATLPDNCIWLEGAAISRTTYANLFAIYGTTYGAGDGSTTFNLPDFRNRAIWGSDTFGYLSAGLPNHQHWTTLDSGWGESPFNYVSLKWDNGDRIKYRGQTVGTSWASDSNGIYGASNTVQPPAIKVRVYTRYQ